MESHELGSFSNVRPLLFPSIRTSSSRDISAGVSIGALVLISLIFAGVAEYQWQQDVTPFTAEEWTYAARGGYLNTMIAHYIRNGGL